MTQYRPGTPRPGKAPASEREPFRFKSVRAAKDYVLGRGRTAEQLARLTMAIEFGNSFAAVTEFMKKSEWLFGDHTFLTKRADGLPAEVLITNAQEAIQLFGPARRLTEPALALDSSLDQFRASATALKASMETARSAFNDPKLKRELRHWRSRKQMTAGFALWVSETEKLDPPLGPKEFDALVQIVGLRLPAEEFEKDPKPTDTREEAARKLFEKVKKNILPGLRRFLKS